MSAIDDRFHEEIPWNYAVDPETGELYQVSSDLDGQGRELPDPVPFAPPVKGTQGDALIEMVRRLVRSEVSQMAEAAGVETFEESEDFDVPDDHPDPRTPYEAVFDPPLPAPHPRQEAVGGGAGEGVGSPKSADPAPASPNETPKNAS